MTTAWRVLMVDDDGALLKSSKRLLEARSLNDDGDTCVMDTTSSFEEALRRLEATRPDIVILDILDDSSADGDQAGLRAYEAIRATQFLPIIFYTALPHVSEDLQRPPFTQVVSKTEEDEEGPPALRVAVADIVASGLPSIARAITATVRKVERDVMITLVEPHWSEISVPERVPEVGHLLARTLARSLDAGGDALQQVLTAGAPPDRKGVHPLRYYVFHQQGDFFTGEILHLAALPTGASGPEADHTEATDGSGPDDVRNTLPDDSWWTILTPSCDFVTGDGREPKAEFVVLAESFPIAAHPDSATFLREPVSGDGSRKRRDAVEALVMDTAAPVNRYRYLPKAWIVPDLVVDLQRLVSVRYAELVAFRRVARLDDPYAQSLVAQMIAYLGRTGTPDLDKTAERDRVLTYLDGLRTDK